MKWNKTLEVIFLSDFTPNQTAVISNIHISERKLSRGLAVSSFILSPLPVQRQTNADLYKAEEPLMGHLFTALRPALLSSLEDVLLLRLLGVYMTKEINETGQHLWGKHTTHQIRQNQGSSKQSEENWEASPPVRNSFSGLVNSWISVRSWVYLRYLKLSCLAPLKEMPVHHWHLSNQMCCPEMLSLSLWSKLTTHVMWWSQRWEEGVFCAAAVPAITRSLKYHKRFHFLPPPEMPFSPNTQKSVLLIMTSRRPLTFYFMLLLVVVFDSGDICTR